MARSMRNAQLLLFSRTLNTSQLRYFNRNSRSIETLAFEEIQTTPDKPHKATAFILHGLLGSGRNWRSFTRTLLSHISNSPPSIDWRVVLVDLRNHGRSADVKGLDPPHDMVNAAKDLATLVKSQGWDWPHVVIGHSMGGKVAMQFAQSCARGEYGESAVLPKQLWVLDSVPGEVDPEDSDGEVEKVLQTLQGLSSLIPSRKDGVVTEFKYDKEEAWDLHLRRAIKEDEMQEALDCLGKLNSISFAGRVDKVLNSISFAYRVGKVVCRHAKSGSFSVSSCCEFC